VRSSFRAAQPGALAANRMVWLPGAFHSAQDFLDAGFPDAVRLRQIALDLMFVDLELRHLGDREALKRLRSDIVLPARNLGVAVWLAGVSLGGLLALGYAVDHPGELQGLCLLAPYLGNRMLIGEIAAAPGVKAWDPGELAQVDEERRIWRYIKEAADPRLLYLGFGQQDRFSAGQTLLAQTLPADSVDIVEGGHEWRTWTTLWENFLDSRFA
jgi:pimeloyl-ACP methyl ester carboxylesterase